MDTSSNSSQTLLEETGRKLKPVSAEEKLRLLKQQLMEKANRENSSFPLSFGQKALWFIQQSAPDRSTYNEALAVKITSSLNVAALKKSFQRLLNRHSVLRTSYIVQEGVLQQQVRGFEEISFEETDASGWDDETIRAKALETYSRPFDLATGPVIRIRLFRRSQADHVLLAVIHHICCDGWSMMVLMDDLSLLYNNETKGTDVPLSPLPLTYSDHVRSEETLLSSPRGEELWKYWNKVLEGELPLLQLPADRSRPAVKTDNGSSAYFNLSPELSAKLKMLSRKEGTSLYVTLLAAFQVLLSKFSGQEDIITGTPVAGRTKSAYERMMGYFVNPVAIRGNTGGDPAFVSFLGQIRKTVLDALSHQEFPFPLIVEKLNIPRDVSRTPVFQAMFFLQTIQQYDSAAELLIPGNQGTSVKLGDLHLEYFHFPHKEGRFDVTLEMIEGKEGLSGLFKYNTDLFDASSIERIIAGFKILLECIAENPAARISELSVLTNEQRAQVLQEWNDTEEIFEGKQFVHELFEEQAAQNPHMPAVVFEDQKLSYQDLNERANRLARYLKEKGAGPEVLVGICLERSAEVMVSILAIMKAGAGYVPVDPGFPGERLLYMAENSGMKILIAENRLHDQFSATGIQMICPGKDSEAIKKQSAENLTNIASPDNLTYVIYTSGSTGQPKGVGVEFRQLHNYVKGVTSRLDLNHQASYATVSTFAADLGNTVIFPSLITGGCLHIISGERITDPQAFAAYMRKHRIDCIKITPSHMEALMNADDPSEVLPVKRLILGGESCSAALLAKVEQLAPECLVFNHYGPTETTVGAITCQLSGRSTSHIPLGRPVPNTRTYLLDQYRQPVPVGVAGELYIGGAGVARGYLNNESLTGERFLPDPFVQKDGARMYRTGDLAKYLPDGNIVFLGRADGQVKIRGYRIELGEIKSAILAHSEVADVFVTTYEHKTGKNLCAYIVPSVSGKFSEGELRIFLENKLPGYMLPQAFVVLEKLPLTSNGKIDHRALPAPSEMQERTRGYGHPSDATEEVITGIWSDVLGRNDIGIHDHFFHIGGHSLLATQVISRIRSAFSVDLPVHRLFVSPTVSGLSEYVRSLSASVNLSSIAPAERKKDIPLSFPQQRLWILDQLNGQSALYNMPAVLRFEGRLELEYLEAAVNEVYRRHEILRTNFTGSEDGPVQIIHSEVNVILPLIDLVGLPRQEQAVTIDRLITEETSSPFDLERDPLLRISLIKTSAESHLLLFTMHHIISDRWSIGILIREISQLYKKYHHQDISDLPTLIIQYADFAVWQKEWMSGKVYAELYQYWKGKLEGAPPLLELPADFSRPSIPSLKGSAEKFEVKPELTGRLISLSRKAGATLYMTMMAAYAVLLSKYAGLTDILIGTIIANRNRKETEPLIGFFANTLVFRNDLSGDPSFREFLEQVRNTSLDAYAHQDFPFEKLVEELRPERNLSYAPIVQVMFNFKNIAVDTLDLPGLSISYVEVEKISAKYDLSLVMEETNNGMSGVFEYNTDLFGPKLIKRMTGHFLFLLDDIVLYPERKLSEISLRGNEENKKMEDVFMKDLDDL